MEHQSTLFPAAGTAEGLSTVPISTLPPEAGIPFEEQKKARRAEKYKTNREKIRAEQLEYHKANREKICARKKAHYRANRERLVAIRAAYVAANKETVRSDSVEYTKRRRKLDPVFRLATRLRGRVLKAFKSQQAEKTRSTFNLLGCTRDELRQHLVSQFREGMTLENHGKVWHIDHIRPCASFDLSDPNHAILCFHYSNLQPLFVDENLRKSDKWVPTETRPLAA